MVPDFIKLTCPGKDPWYVETSSIAALHRFHDEASGIDLTTVVLTADNVPIMCEQTPEEIIKLVTYTPDCGELV
jgi:hypothetical protein